MTTDPNSPEVLKSVPSELEAMTIVSALANRGVKASTTGVYTAGFRAESPGEVHVTVKHEDLERAREIISQIEQEKTVLDWSQIDVGEPEE